MSKMSRRGFMMRSAAIAGTSLIPIPKAMALVAPARPPLFWFAIGHSDEMAYPVLAESLDQAISHYAHEHCQTKGEACPECESPACSEHLNPSEWDDPYDWIEEYSSQPKNWASVPMDREPTNLEWMKAGFNVPCEDCDYGDYGECTECYEHNGRAICCECLEIARAAKLDDIIGNGYPTMFQGSKL